jgi:hypothetical protein
MLGPLYPRDHGCVTVLFDLDDPKQVALFRVLEVSFGERHALSEELDPPRYHCLSILPGGAREVLR